MWILKYKPEVNEFSPYLPYFVEFKLEEGKQLIVTSDEESEAKVYPSKKEAKEDRKYLNGRYDISDWDIIPTFYHTVSKG
jgi:hypothetical protein